MDVTQSGSLSVTTAEIAANYCEHEGVGKSCEACRIVVADVMTAMGWAIQVKQGERRG